MEKFCIYNDELKGLGLTMNEKALLSIYKYFTEKGKMKCCTLTNRDLANELEINEVYFSKLKRGLKEKGFIATDGGLRVKYLWERNRITFTEKNELKSKLFDCIWELNSNIEYAHLELFDKEIEDVWTCATLNDDNSRVIFEDVLEDIVNKIILNYKEYQLNQDELLDKIIKVDPKIEINRYVTVQVKSWFNNKTDRNNKKTKKTFSNYDILLYASELGKVRDLNNI